jgi:hypothetical protein
MTRVVGLIEQSKATLCLSRASYKANCVMDFCTPIDTLSHCFILEFLTCPARFARATLNLDKYRLSPSRAILSMQLKYVPDNHGQ